MKKFSLLSQFSLLSLVLFIVIGAALGYGLSQYFEQQELERQKQALGALLQPAVAQFMDEQTMATGAKGQKYKDIDYAFTFLAGVGLVRVKIWNNAGMVVYSDDATLVGQTYPVSDELRESLEGRTTASISPLAKAENASERGFGELMEVYAPLRLPGQNDVKGAFEGYFEIDDLRLLLDQTTAYIWKVIVMGFVFLYLSLFAIVRGASQRITRQSRENALLLADTQRKAARLEAVNALARSINQPSLDLGRVFQTALLGVDRIAVHNGASITLLDEHTGEVVSRVTSSSSREDASSLIELCADCEKDLLADGSVIVYVDTKQAKEAPVLALAAQGVRSFVVCSISLGERRLGILLVVSAKPGAFDEDVAAILNGLADQLAVAVENTRLIREAAETAALRETNRLKDEFVSMVSHELRTPLASIKGYSHTLLAADGGWDDTTRAEFLGVIADESDKLTDLVENLLEMSRIGAGRLPVIPEPILLSRFCQGVVDRVAKHYPEIKFECGLDDPLPVVEADPRRVEQVLVNLLQNAAKYSGSDVVRIGGSYDGGSEVVITIEDHGKGIAPEHLPQLFDKFYRVDNGSNGKEAVGTGLGLAICKALVEAQGGRIWVNSWPGLGTTFSFSLPALVLHGEGERLSAATPGAR
jgi:signal transduction histidine kinase